MMDFWTYLTLGFDNETLRYFALLSLAIVVILSAILGLIGIIILCIDKTPWWALLLIPLVVWIFVGVNFVQYLGDVVWVIE